MKHVKFTVMLPLALAAAAVGISGCSNGGSSSATSSYSLVRTFNALVNSPSQGVNFVYRNQNINGTAPVPYGTISPTGVNTLPTGQQTRYWSVASGGNATLGQTVGVDVLSPPPNPTSLAPTLQTYFDPHTGGTNGMFTIVAAGESGATGAAAPQLKRYIDNPTLPGTSNTAEVRFINLSPDSTNLNIQNNGGPITGLTNIAYLGDSGYIAVPVTAGTPLVLTVRDNANNTIATHTSPITYTFNAGNAYTIWAVGLTASAGGSTPFDLVVTLDQ